MSGEFLVLAITEHKLVNAVLFFVCEPDLILTFPVWELKRHSQLAYTSRNEMEFGADEPKEKGTVL